MVMRKGENQTNGPQPVQVEMYSHATRHAHLLASITQPGQLGKLGVLKASAACVICHHTHTHTVRKLGREGGRKRGGRREREREGWRGARKRGREREGEGDRERKGERGRREGGRERGREREGERERSSVPPISTHQTRSMRIEGNSQTISDLILLKGQKKETGRRHPPPLRPPTHTLLHPPPTNTHTHTHPKPS